VPLDNPLGLPRTRRLVNTLQYQRVLKGGFRFGVGVFLVFACPNDLGSPRLGLAMSKRYARRAYDRNRLKRIARESFRIHGSELPAVDIVVLATAKAPNSTSKTLFSALGQAWNSIRNASWVKP
jgi:ribonuclease P protein component